MSITDTMPLLGMPWLSRGGIRLSTTPLPGLQPEVIQELESSYTGVLSPEMRQLLQTSCGLEGTALGSVDFTGPVASGGALEHFPTLPDLGQR